MGEQLCGAEGVTFLAGVCHHSDHSSEHVRKHPAKCFLIRMALKQLFFNVVSMPNIKLTVF